MSGSERGRLSGRDVGWIPKSHQGGLGKLSPSERRIGHCRESRARPLEVVVHRRRHGPIVIWLPEETRPARRRDTGGEFKATSSRVVQGGPWPGDGRRSFQRKPARVKVRHHGERTNMVDAEKVREPATILIRPAHRRRRAVGPVRFERLGGLPRCAMLKRAG
jgi:hypothetical protein